MAQFLFFLDGKAVGFTLLIVVMLLTLFYMYSKREVTVRRVAALDAIDEGIGRSAEMGRPVINSIGTCDGGMSTWTVSALSILKYVTSKCVALGIPLYVPLGGSEAVYTPMEVARDIVRTEYEMAGKLDEYRPDNMPFLSGRQFSWASGYVGMMLRLKPGVNILLGEQMGTAMYLSEIGHEVGALQISGAHYITNIACLAASADYLAIGEDMLAAGAYLSKDPNQIASIRASDLMKYLFIVVLIVGSVLASFGNKIVATLLGY